MPAADDLVLFGADPEFPLTTKNGVPVAPWVITKGTKDNHELIGGGDCELHSDGVALEVNFNAAHGHSFKKRVRYVYNLVKSYCQERGAYISVAPEFRGYSKDILEHPLVTSAIGCNLDYSAYSQATSIPRPPPVDSIKGDMRYFGGHLHFGYDISLCPPWAFVRFVEALVYLPIMRYDSQKERRKYYGCAGLFRPKSYGVEYRTPSNFWVSRDNCIDVITYNTTQIVQALMESPEKTNKWFKDQPWKDVKRHVDTGESNGGTSLFSSMRSSFPMPLVSLDD